MEKDLSSLYSEKKDEEDHVAPFNIKLSKSVLVTTPKNSSSLLDENKSLSQWTDDVFTQSVFYHGSDDLIWGKFFVCVYKSPSNNKLNAIIFDKLGTSCFESVDISSGSQYYPAIENLSPSDQESNVKKCIAVVLLQRYPLLSQSDLSQILSNKSENCDYDPPYAGDLASSCKLITAVPPEGLGKRFFTSGLLQDRFVSSALLDVIYENSESTIELNNRLVFHLGEQLEQLFNPVTEYSPEQTEYGYKAPDDELPTESDSDLVKAICNELLQLQTNFTFSLVEFLQKFLIALRVRVLNEEIDGLSTTKLNRLFPPTIDEVTRINCIFLDSLKTATPYGSLEVLKACSITIPYFYKAYTRHEAATKNFSKDIKLFIRHFSDIIPEREVYTEMKIESIIKGPQEKLLKLKLIIERLWKSKKWKPENQEMAKKCYDNIIDVIDSFGKLDSPLHSYSTRVFTPSGKILTELAKCWPVELQYKWLKRRVVGVYDVVDLNDESKRNLLVIFSDYVVFINILEAGSYYTSDGSNRPSISDILMNSLINEVPLPSKIPKLKVERHCYIDEVLVSILDKSSLRFDRLKGKDSFSTVCKLSSSFISSSSVADLITKARILEKDTAFHLFKASRSHFTLYSTAHELCAYDAENIKSKFALFLNIPPSEEILEANNLHLALFARFRNNDDNDNLVILDILTKHENKHIEVTSDNIVFTIINQLAIEIPICYSSLKSSMAKDLLCVNENLVKDLEHQLKEAKGCSTNENEAIDSKVSNESTFDATHEKKRSYGTITTFRSYTSDLKDSSSGNKGKLTMETKEISPVKPIKKPAKKPREVQKKTKTEASKADHIKKKTSKKGKGFFGVLKNVFGNKSKSKPLPVQREPKKIPQRHPKSPVKKPTTLEKKSSSKRAVVPSSKIEKKSSPSSTKEPQSAKSSLEAVEFKSRGLIGKSPDVEKGPHPQENTRISSVVRDTKFASYIPSQPVAEISKIEKDVEPEADQSIKQGNLSNFADVERSASPHPEKPDAETEDQIMEKTTESSQVHGKKELPDLAEMAMTNRVPAILTGDQNIDTQSEALRVEDVANVDDNDENRQNESRVFNDDLFGDFIPKPSGSEQDNISGSNSLFPEGEILQKKGVISSNSNISVRTDDDVSTLTQKFSSRADKALNENPHGLKDTNNESRDVILGEDHKYKATAEETTKPKNLVEKRAERKGIFPIIPKLAPPASKINFQRSPSYIELFQGMRVVLDKHDAHYNWKRLASQVSLSDGLKVNTEDDAAIASESHDDINAERMTQISEAVEDEMQQPIPTYLPKGNLCDSSIENGDDKLFVIDEKLKEELKGSKTVNEDVGSNNLSHSIPKIEKPPVFKVIRTSPVRIIGKTFEDIRKNENASPSDLSFTYDTHNEDEPDKRLMELKFPSQDEIPDDRFYTPAEEPTAAFPVEKLPKTLRNVDITTSNNKSTDDKLNKSIEQNPTELLDDLEFSSFNIAFGNTSMSTDNVKTSSDLSSNKTVSENATKVQESPSGPLIYVLPQSSAKREKEGFLRKKENNAPIWVSPSKIDFADLSRRTKALTPERHTVPLKTNDGRTHKNVEGGSIGNMTNILLSKDASYAYLTDFVALSDNEDGDGKESYVTDGPEKLKFY